jgi:hypothetical protein
VATLSDQLKRNRQRDQGLVRGPGGQLQQLTGAGIQQLAEARGLEAPPTSPLGGQAIGATPDQVKMLGDARQKRAALDIGATGGLVEARRTRQARTEATAEEEATFAKSEALQKLGSTGQKTGELIDAATASLTSAQLAETPIALTPAGQQLPDEAKKLLTDYVSGANRSPDTLRQLAEVLGVPDTEVNVLQYIDASTLTPELQKSLATDLAQLAPDTITLAQLYPEGVSSSLGLTESEMGSLGLTEEQLAGFTFANLQDFLEQEQRTLFADPTTVRIGLANKNLSQAEREELRGQLRGMAGAGVLGVEQAVADLVTQIEAADTVTYRDPVTGETVSRTIGDLLADENITTLITQFLGLTPQRQQELLADAANPLASLYKWINSNAENIRTLTTEGAEAFTAEQKQLEENIALANVSGFPVPASLMAAIYGENWNKFGAGKLDANAPLYQLMAKSANPQPVIALLSGLPAETLTRLNKVPAGKLTVDLVNQVATDNSNLTALTELIDPKTGSPTDFLKFEKLLGTILPISPFELGRLGELLRLGLVKDSSGLLALLSPPNYIPSLDPDSGKIGEMRPGVAGKILEILRGMSGQLEVTGQSVRNLLGQALPTRAISENKRILDTHNSYIGSRLRAGEKISDLLRDSDLSTISRWEDSLKLLAEKTGIKQYRDAYAQIQILRVRKQDEERVAREASAAAAAETEQARVRAGEARRRLATGNYRPEELPDIYQTITAQWGPAERSQFNVQQFTELLGKAPGQIATIASLLQYPDYATDLRRLMRISTLHPGIASAILTEVSNRRAAGKLVAGAYLREIMKDPVTALRNITFDNPNVKEGFGSRLQLVEDPRSSLGYRLARR